MIEWSDKISTKVSERRSDVQGGVAEMCIEHLVLSLPITPAELLSLPAVTALYTATPTCTVQYVLSSD